MYLKKLELHGFKSFAGATTLELERGISAVVGPNGSGKSNIADALRFVLGEQSMKLIRSKKGEDLIFSGSATKPRMSIGSVALHFDNHDRSFPVEFESVIFKRKIFRDGENQYFINDAQVRLKDVAEYIAKAHLGLKGYTVINQGMGDAILNASPKERKEIIFEALGLKEFQLKKADALLKLSHTRVNLEKAQGIINEIEPHLKFLKRQAEKIEERHTFELKLRELEAHHLRMKLSVVLHSLERCERDMKGKQAERDRLQTERDNLERELERYAGGIAQALEDADRFEKELFTLETERNSIEREVGKIEGMIASAEELKIVEAIPVDIVVVKSELVRLRGILREAISSEMLDEMREKVRAFRGSFEVFVDNVVSGKMPAAPLTVDHEKAQRVHELKERKHILFDTLKMSDEKMRHAKETRFKSQGEHHAARERIFELKEAKREKEREIERLTILLETMHREIESLHKEKTMLDKESEIIRGGQDLVSFANVVIADSNDEELRRDIERLKLKLENIDLIDNNIKKEYEETQERYRFLTTESEDLSRALSSLEKVIVDLDGIIAERFKDAFKKINEKFNDYFKLLFEGGSAHIETVDIRTDDSDGESGERLAVDYGIDVAVSLPRKKTTGIAVLSGGERTLTSLSLLFALVSVSPPPFLVLDEIDAPLDEANSLRFAKILNELKEHTQFIVITHNKETMRQSDVLYGITMQEDGVSKILSLKFEDGAALLSR